MMPTLVTTNLLFLLAGLHGGVGSGGTAPQPPPPVLLAQAGGAPAPDQPLKDLQVVKVHFGFNDSELTTEARDALARVAKCLKDQPNIRIQIEGNADERGTAEFNLALGEKRANAVRQYLESLGIMPGTIKVVSYGEEKPVVEGHDEPAWAANRRVEFQAGGTLKAVAGCTTGTDGQGGTENADKDANANKDKKDDTAGKDTKGTGDGNNGKGQGDCQNAAAFRIPWWLGPLVAAVGLPGPLLAVPAILSMVVISPLTLTKPREAQFPITGGTSPTYNNKTSAQNFGGSIWGLINQPQPLAAGIAAAVAGVVILFSALATAAFFGAGGIITLIWFLQPKGEDCDKAAARAAEEGR